ncbi:MAG: flippase-like domain-containing protein [Actinomycetota bacterium]|nr:flippase-like domain-containing protein [Actinomycetota bacterium]
MEEPEGRESQATDVRDLYADAGTPKDRRFALLGTLISIGALAGVVIWATKQEPPALPSGRAQILALLGAVAIYGFTTALRGERWWRLLEDSEAHASRTDAYALTAVGYMGNNVLPARGGDVIRTVLLMPRSRVNARTIVGTLVAERLLDVLFLLSLFALLGYAVLRGIRTPDTQLLVFGGIGGVALLAVLALTLYRLRDRPLVRRGLSLIAPLARPTRRLRGVHAAAMFGWTALIWACEALMFVLVAHSVGVEMDLLEAGYLMAVASVFLLIPAGPGYVGTLDAAIVFGLGAIGTDGSEAVSYLLMLRFVVFVPVTLAGVGLLLTRYRGSAPLARPAGSRNA